MERVAAKPGKAAVRGSGRRRHPATQAILNRDTQGRLRKKLVVLKIEIWIAQYLRRYCSLPEPDVEEAPYAVEMSSKNPRWRPSARP